MKIKINKFFIKAVRLFLDLIIRTKRGGQVMFSKTLGRFINFFAGMVFNLALVPLYKLYLKSKNNLIEFLGLNKQTNLFLVSHRKAIHIVMVFLTIITVIVNLQIGETRAESQFGQNILLASLIKNEQLGSLIEKRAGTTSPQVISYAENEGFLVESMPSLEDADMDGFDEGFIGTTTDESTLVKPEIPSSDQTEEEIITEKPINEQRKTYTTYTVKQGDVLGAIAKKFGLKTTTLLWANNLTERTLIRPGDSLRIPPTDGISHTVKKRETLLAIAKEYRTSVKNIIDYNNLTSANDISIGQQLFIPGGEKPKPEYVAPVKKPKSVIDKLIIPDSAPIVSSDRMLWPAGSHRITQYFNWRHNGIDIGRIKSGPAYPPLYAADDGVVIKAKSSGWNGGYGNHVIIKHGDGTKSTLYGHMQEVYVKEGQVVTKGQTIGLMGNTGRSTGTHLHFEVRIGKTRVNPLKYVK